MLLRIGSKMYPVADLAEATARYQKERDRSGKGGSSFPVGIVNGGTHHISYNGRVWVGSPQSWTPGQQPVLEANGHAPVARIPVFADGRQGSSVC